MRLRLTNARYADMRDFTVKSGDITIENGKFSYVGKSCNNECDRVIDLKNDLVIPGFNNAHTHSPMTFLRSYADDLPLDRWLNEAVFPHEARLTPDDCYTLTKLAVCEYLTSGITSCFDMYFNPDAVAQALVDTGFRGVLCGSINDFTDSAEKMDGYFDRINRMSPLVSYVIGFHAEYTCSDRLLRETAQLAHQRKSPVWCHNSETPKETEECIARHGMTPTAYFDSMDMFRYGGGGYHCCYLSDDDFRIFMERGLTVVTNPASNLKLASGVPDLVRADKMGINLAIGTDGPASNNALDMFREMYLTTALQKLTLSDAAAMPAQRVLEAAVCGGAKAMGLDGCGYIEEGMNADFTVIDMSRPNMQPENNILKNLVLSGSKDNIRMTAVNGRILYENGEFFIGEDIFTLYEKAARICERIFKA